MVTLDKRTLEQRYVALCNYIEQFKLYKEYDKTTIINVELKMFQIILSLWDEASGVVNPSEKISFVLFKTYDNDVCLDITTEVINVSKKMDVLSIATGVRRETTKIKVESSTIRIQTYQKKLMVKLNHRETKSKKVEKTLTALIKAVINEK